MAEPSVKARGWAIFDRITAEAAVDGYTNPWVKDEAGQLLFEPDFDVLCDLLGVPLFLKANSQSGVPALALDVWVAYELRRAGFDEDAVWPRATYPRIMPGPIAALLKAVRRIKKADRELFEKRLLVQSSKGIVASSANLLGKNYRKQVDVVISDWSTGPELLISTKRMDSSFGKNAANRVEESYGDAKNLRLRHPQAALGFVYGLRSTILTKEPKKAKWLVDLLGKLGREEDAYHAVCLLLLDYDSEPPAGGDGDDGTVTVSDDADDDADDDAGIELVDVGEVQSALDSLPEVRILHGQVPSNLQPARFLSVMVSRILNNTPIDYHEEARSRRESPRTAPRDANSGGQPG